MTISRRQFVASTATVAATAAAGPWMTAAAAGPPGSDSPTTFTLPELPYAYDAIEGMDEKTMRIHHDLHHGGYVKKLNAALEGETNRPSTIEAILGGLDDFSAAGRTAIRNNGGGHYNHTLYWESMAPEGRGGSPSRHLASALERSFGTVDRALARLVEESLGVFGSGWGWIVLKPDGRLAVTTTANQDNPLMGPMIAETPGTPILGVDVWEHAYYLKYQNQRKSYLENFATVVHWKNVSRRYEALIRERSVPNVSPEG